MEAAPKSLYFMETIKNDPFTSNSIRFDKDPTLSYNTVQKHIYKQHSLSNNQNIDTVTISPQCSPCSSASRPRRRPAPSATGLSGMRVRAIGSLVPSCKETNTIKYNNYRKQ